MALASSQIREQMYIAQEHDLNNILTRLNSIKMNLSNNMNDLLNVGTNLDPDSPESRVIEARRQKLALLEKKMDMEIAQYQNRLKAVESLRNQSKETVNRAIEKSYGGRH
ncbi:MAG: hypothetical protein PHX18_00675 [Candidatus Gastranaerophilales bacterium]|nr:hypothetical protein [Candidatus Gastranaerophilales bacterium]